MTGASKGNGKLTYPVGLITADEVAIGGLVVDLAPSTSVKNMYVTGLFYWSITPFNFEMGNTYVFAASVPGFLSSFVGSYYGGVRPVINLIKDIKFSKGDGSSSSPFEI